MLERINCGRAHAAAGRAGTGTGLGRARGLDEHRAGTSAGLGQARGWDERIAPLDPHRPGPAPAPRAINGSAGTPLSICSQPWLPSRPRRRSPRPGSAAGCRCGASSGWSWCRCPRASTAISSSGTRTWCCAPSAAGATSPTACTTGWVGARGARSAHPAAAEHLAGLQGIGAGVFLAVLSKAACASLPEGNSRGDGSGAATKGGAKRRPFGC